MKNDPRVPTHEQTEECEFCGYSTADLHWTNMSGDRAGWLCTVCWTTYAGNAFCFPRLHDNLDVMQVVAHCTNLILERLPEKEKET